MKRKRLKRDADVAFGGWNVSLLEHCKRVLVDKRTRRRTRVVRFDSDLNLGLAGVSLQVDPRTGNLGLGRYLETLCGSFRIGKA